MTPAERLAELVEEFGEPYEDSGLPTLEPGAPFVLVEIDHLPAGNSIAYSAHKSLELAGVYCGFEEGHYEPEVLVNLETGQRFDPRRATTFECADGPCSSLLMPGEACADCGKLATEDTE